MIWLYPTLKVSPVAAISLRHIEIFHAVMTTGNLTEAASLLNTSQPTVSRELARFERLMQMALFERVRGRLHPTAQGLRLFEEVQRSYYGLERIVSAADDIRRFQQAQLSIACLPVFSQSLLPEVCQPLLADYPTLNLHIIPQESPLLEEWLSAQRHDLGLTENNTTPAGTERQTLMQLSEVCVLPSRHPLASKPVLTPQDFRHQPFISLSSADSYRQWLDHLFQEAGVERSMVMETHSAASVCAMVRAGVGLSIVNPLTAADYAASRHGVVVRHFSIDVPFTVSLIRPLHRPASALVDVVTEHLQRFAQAFPARLQQLIDGKMTDNAGN
ncbi:DNA-binding transcriptional regulator, LysR family [Lonsdalea quercina]|uniref:DNA-binding transcriptional regulator, LysR family n=1 Tax=Lonsdalea quercina TaxID=71657 RepID=A0A1H4ANH5_9GAMM|nr:DNA-binding transcriptional regulator, LysR family [Lonsdalea quercina]